MDSQVNIALKNFKEFFLINYFFFSKCPEKMGRLKRCLHTGFRFNGSFHEAIGSVLVIAQCFGVMPVCGVKCDSAEQLRFEWQSVRAVYSAIAFVGVVWYMGLTIWNTANQDIDFSQIGWCTLFTLHLVQFNQHDCINLLILLIFIIFFSTFNFLRNIRLRPVIVRFSGQEMARFNATLGNC